MIRAAAAAPGPRLALFFGAAFASVGVHLPFWPVWLEARGLDAGAIGLALAAGLWAKVVLNPLVARVADATGERRRVMVALAGATTVGVALFALVHDLWALVALTALTSACFGSLLPLGDNLAMLHVRGGGVDYGRVRLWGSVTFILSALLGGRLLGLYGAGAVLPLWLATMAATWLACLLLPDALPDARSGDAPIAAGASAVRRLLAEPRLLLLFAGAGLIQASHSVYYAFGTLHWRAAGHGDAAIGFLWAEGVVVEVVLFACGGALLRRLGAGRLLVLAGLLTALRWTLTAASAELAVLLVAQTLHAASFAATHLAAVHEIQRLAPPGLSATAQSVYAAYATGALMGLVMPASGQLYGAFGGGGAYLAMAALALAGALLAVLLRRRRTASAGG
ncbi:MAG TPA: MFS transporter [Geminicoccaceae bacterium]|nr:MFS transporter [Geminicoccaceae bacterium]